MADPRVDDAELASLYTEMRELVGVRLDLLRVPRSILRVLEPSQVGTIVGTLMDACIPELTTILRGAGVRRPSGIFRHEGVVGEREGYPAYRHSSGLRLELKLLYRTPSGITMKESPTPREASARLTQKVTLKNIDPKNDVLMVVAYELRPLAEATDLCSPTIMDVGLFPMIDCILARDDRLLRSGGKWFGNYETPCVPSKIGRQKRKLGEPLDESTYGRKESEGKDFNEDTNFGKLRRIPYKPLQLFLKKHGAKYAPKGDWPEPWTI